LFCQKNKVKMRFVSPEIKIPDNENSQ